MTGGREGRGGGREGGREGDYSCSFVSAPPTSRSMGGRKGVSEGERERGREGREGVRERGREGGKGGRD